MVDLDGCLLGVGFDLPDRVRLIDSALIGPPDLWLSKPMNGASLSDRTPLVY